MSDTTDLGGNTEFLELKHRILSKQHCGFKHCFVQSQHGNFVAYGCHFVRHDQPYKETL